MLLHGLFYPGGRCAFTIVLTVAKRTVQERRPGVPRGSSSTFARAPHCSSSIPPFFLRFGPGPTSK